MLTRLAVLILALSQGVAFVAGMRGVSRRFASGAALLCPTIVLGVCLSRMGPRMEWSAISRLEAGFLLFNLASALACVFLLRTGGRPPALFWAAWIANGLSCAMMIYLAFVFRLF